MDANVRSWPDSFRGRHPTGTELSRGQLPLPLMEHDGRSSPEAVIAGRFLDVQRGSRSTMSLYGSIEQ
jgi:hypothetical protein